MAITRTAKGTNNNKTGTTLTISSVTINAGRMLIVGTESDNNPTGVTFDGVALTQACSARNGTHLTARIYFLLVSATTTANIVLTKTNNEASAIWAIEVEGVYSLDKTSTATGVSTTPGSGTTATTAYAEEIWIGNIGTEGPSTDAAGTWSDSFNAGQRVGTTGGADASNVTGSEGFLIVSSTGAAGAALTGITSRDWGACVATFSPAQIVDVPVATSAAYGILENDSGVTISDVLVAISGANGRDIPQVNVGVLVASASGDAQSPTRIEVSIDFAGAVSLGLSPSQAVGIAAADAVSQGISPSSSLGVAAAIAQALGFDPSIAVSAGAAALGVSSAHDPIAAFSISPAVAIATGIDLSGLALSLSVAFGTSLANPAAVSPSTPFAGAVSSANDLSEVAIGLGIAAALSGGADPALALMLGTAFAASSALGPASAVLAPFAGATSSANDLSEIAIGLGIAAALSGGVDPGLALSLGAAFASSSAHGPGPAVSAPFSDATSTALDLSGVAIGLDAAGGSSNGSGPSIAVYLGTAIAVSSANDPTATNVFSERLLVIEARERCFEIKGSRRDYVLSAEERPFSLQVERREFVLDVDERVYDLPATRGPS